MKITTFISIMMLSLVMAPCALAQSEYRWTASVHLGTTDLDTLTSAGGSSNGPGINYDGALSGDSSHWAISLAYEFLPWLGARAMFERATGFDMIGRCPAGMVCATIFRPDLIDQADLESWTLAAQPRFHFNDQLSIHGILGLSFWDISTDGVLPGDSGTDFTVGAGITWRPAPRVELGLEYQYADFDYDAYRFNLGFRF